MYEAAVVLMTRVKRASGLKEWADVIAKRSGAGKARIALARKLAVILHSIWRSGEPFGARTSNQMLRRMLPTAERTVTPERQQKEEKGY
jgi:hypothetical protein